MKKIDHIAAILTTALLWAPVTQANHNSEESLLNRVGAVGSLNVGDVPASAAPAAADSAPVDGESVYSASCSACHTSGVGGAPVVGEVDDWVDRIAAGMESMVTHAIDGFQGSSGVMPAKGGNPSLSDEQVTAAVEHMVENSQ